MILFFTPVVRRTIEKGFGRTLAWLILFLAAIQLVDILVTLGASWSQVYFLHDAVVGVRILSKLTLLASYIVFSVSVIKDLMSKTIRDTMHWSCIVITVATNLIYLRV